jgi:hypothetical protein
MIDFASCLQQVNGLVSSLHQQHSGNSTLNSADKSTVGKVLKDLNILAGKISPKSNGANSIGSGHDCDIEMLYVFCPLS